MKCVRIESRFRAGTELPLEFRVRALTRKAIHSTTQEIRIYYP